MTVKYMSHKEIFIYFMLGLGIGFAGYILPFFLFFLNVIYTNIVSYLTYPLMFVGPLVFWVVIPLVEVFKRRRQQ
ncbi:MAG: hypothetical protein GH152_04605 [Dehalococcoidia bacterium]|nr:hypothetical protein [Dehalococcoidia bacterium]